MEYVGEIVTREQMARRAETYAAQGQRHFYFMTLRPNQIIDATCRGNLSRFMNHSCAPNCETQKWIVGGRMRIGLFTTRTVKAATELTFDYKFVRFGYESHGERGCGKCQFTFVCVRWGLRGCVCDRRGHPPSSSTSVYALLKITRGPLTETRRKSACVERPIARGSLASPPRTRRGDERAVAVARKKAVQWAMWPATSPPRGKRRSWSRFWRLSRRA